MPALSSSFVMRFSVTGSGFSQASIIKHLKHLSERLKIGEHFFEARSFRGNTLLIAAGSSIHKNRLFAVLGLSMSNVSTLRGRENM